MSLSWAPSNPQDHRSRREGIQDRSHRPHQTQGDVDPNIGNFMGRRRRVVQVLYNLLANAVGFSPQDATSA